nr:hypothetical protein [Pectobacterium carotovorum]
MSKDFLVTLLVLYIMLAIFWYMLWASQLSRRTILLETLPELTIYLTFGIVLGLIFAGRALYSRSAKKKLKHMLEMFLGGFVLGFLSIVNIFDVYVYLFPDDVISYTSDYKIVFPGPSTGKVVVVKPVYGLKISILGNLNSYALTEKYCLKKGGKEWMHYGSLRGSINSVRILSIINLPISNFALKLANSTVLPTPLVSVDRLKYQKLA